MNTNIFKKVIVTVAVAALFIVPMSFVILQTNDNQTKNAKAYNPYPNINPYYDNNGSVYSSPSYYNYFSNYANPVNQYNSYSGIKNIFGEDVGVKNFNQSRIYSNNSYSTKYKAETKCSNYWFDNCDYFTPSPVYSVSDNPQTYYSEPYINIDVPQPKTSSYYDPSQPTYQDPIRTWDYPDQDFNNDPGYYNS
jgi:hypothetical protein